MKRDTLKLSQHQFIETGRDLNARYYIAFSGGASIFVRDVAELRRFLKIPKGIAMRAALDSWLASLADQDAAKGKAPAPVGDANVEGSFDPLAHDVDNDNTKMIT